MKRLLISVLVLGNISAFANCNSLKIAASAYNSGKIQPDALSLEILTSTNQARKKFISEMEHLDQIAFYEISLDGTQADNSSWLKTTSKLVKINSETKCIFDLSKSLMNENAKAKIDNCIQNKEQLNSKPFKTAQKIDRILNNGKNSDIFDSAFDNNLKLSCL